MQFFETIFKMFGSAIFEVIEVNGGHMVKNLVFMLYGHFPTRHGLKLTITTQKSEKVNNVLHCTGTLLTFSVFKCQLGNFDPCLA
jgi:hypothetical protein